MPLPININDLLSGAPVEWERLEFKEGWNPLAVLHTLCAFANDFHNLGGGYVVIGVAERDGHPLLPPKGLSPGEVEAIQKEALDFIQRNYITETVIKHPDRAEATRVVNFPYAPIEEALANAIYHRSYEEREPVEVRISAEELVVLSYPGPDRSVRLEQLRAGRALPRRYRNRRIGGFLKELEITEGRSTGIPKILDAMKRNGSPPPGFEFDEDHSYFMTRLPVHPQVRRGTSTEVTAQVVEVLRAAADEARTRAELQCAAGIKHREHFRKTYTEPLVSAGWLEKTIPDKPTSRLQKYRLTSKGSAWLAAQPKREGNG